MKKRPEIFPSIIAADFGRFSEEVLRVEQAKADGLHVDIMDGHFVPNLTIGPQALAAFNRTSALFMDVHLMLYQPFEFIENLVRSGADRITFHIEATESPKDLIDYVKKCGVEVGIACNPETSASLLMPWIGRVDLILVMSVHPGFGGQEFLPSVLEKIEDLHAEIRARNAQTKLMVDGGINLLTAKQATQAGADALVVGTFLFEQPDLSSAVASLKEHLIA